jgi:hypothetical protein
VVGVQRIQPPAAPATKHSNFQFHNMSDDCPTAPASRRAAVAPKKHDDGAEDISATHQKFVDSIKLPDDILLDKDGRLVSIKGVPIQKLSMVLLRKICVRFQVTGYKNQSKAVTLRLIPNILKRAELVRCTMKLVVAFEELTTLIEAAQMPSQRGSLTAIGKS